MARPERTPEKGPNAESIRRRPPRVPELPDVVGDGIGGKSRAQLAIEAVPEAAGVVVALDGIPADWSPVQE